MPYVDKNELLNGIYSDNPEDVMLYIARFPTADVPERNVGRWIPVTERLPEKHEEVLVTVAGEIVIAWLNIDGRWRSNDCPEAYLNDHITAWRELPEPYREETEDE